MVPEWPLIGRDTQVRFLAEVLATMRRNGAIVAGAAGVGKTRLAQEGLRLAAERGFTTVWVTGSRSAQAVPFGALAALLPAGRRQPDHGRERLDDLLHDYLETLAERAAGARLALFVDDAHLLDDLSALLVHQAAAMGTAFVLATIRTGEPVPDPVTALWKDGMADRVELHGLGNEAINEMLATVLGGQVDPASAAYLAVHCQGNTLFLRESVIGALDDGTLTNRDGVWRLTGPLSASARLVELVEARLAGLTDAERALLELISFGEPLGTAEVTELSEPGAVESLERKGLVASKATGKRLELRLGHPTYGDVLRERISAIRLRAMAGSLAEIVEGRGGRRREDTLRVAVWRLDAGGASPDLMLEAAITARWRYDFRLASRLARAALTSGGGFEAAFLVAQLDGLQGRTSEAKQQLANLADQALEETQRSRVFLAQLDNYLLSIGSTADGLRVAEAAEAQISDPQWRDELAARRAGVILATLGFRAAVEAAGPLLDEQRGRPPVWACLTLAFSLVRLGRFGEAIALTERGYDAHTALVNPDDGYSFLHLFIRCEALTQAGRLAEAEALANDQYRLAVSEGRSDAQATFAWHLARSVGLRGHVDTAAQQAREAAALYRHQGIDTTVRSALAQLTLALALAGRASEATEVLRKIDSLPVDPVMWSEVDLVEARGWTAAAANDLPGARRLMQEAAGLAGRIGDLVGQGSALHALARLGRPEEAAAQLEQLSEDVEGVLFPLRVAHTRALAAGDPVGLGSVAEKFASIGATLLAAEAAASAAAAWQHQGDARKAAGAERRAAELLAGCERARTPALQTASHVGILTRAELDTALLAASGHTSKQIARELCLSVRTVDNRLHRIYEKLNVSGRSELAAALRLGDRTGQITAR